MTLIPLKYAFKKVKICNYIPYKYIILNKLIYSTNRYMQKMVNINSKKKIYIILSVYLKLLYYKIHSFIKNKKKMFN